MRSFTAILAASALTGVLAQYPPPLPSYDPDEPVVTITMTEDCSTGSYTSTQIDTITIDWCEECEMSPTPTPVGAAGVLTTYTTVWSETCSTGLAPATYTITEPCDTPGLPLPTDHLPPGFTTSAVTISCDCEQHGSTVVLTTPCETATVVPTPAPAVGAVSSPWANATTPTVAAAAPGVMESASTSTSYATVVSSNTTVVCDECEATASPSAASPPIHYASTASHTVSFVAIILASLFGALFLAL